MGTRADFYATENDTLVWIGSIAWDGYQDGIPERVSSAKSEQDFRAAVADFLKERDDASIAGRDPWPWPWETSRTTDFAYRYGSSGVEWSCFGRDWQEWGFEGDELPNAEPPNFPKMDSSDFAVRGDKSGLIVVSG